MSDLLNNYFQQLEAWCQGKLGLSAYHLPSLTKVAYQSDQLFDLASTYKLPIAVCLLQKVAQGKLNLNTLIEVHEYDLRGGISSTLTLLNYNAPVSISILNLLQFMLQESCNSASDIILNMIGGPVEVMNMLNAAGIDNLRVDRSILELLALGEGIDPPPPKACTIQQFQALQQKVSPEAKAAAIRQIKNDTRDQGNPDAMCQLLMQIQNHVILRPAQSELLLNIMQRCQTGAKRLMGRLPLDTKVSHKTGTDMALGQVNDVGIIYLPNKSEQVVIAVYVETTRTLEIAERVIAETARSIYDYFLWT